MVDERPLEVCWRFELAHRWYKEAMRFLEPITAAANTLPAFVSSLRSSGYVPDSRLHQDEFVTRLGGSNTKIGSCSKSSRRSQFEMGVKGVAAYLRKNKLKGESETLKQGDTLLIDGLGWAHFLLGSTGRVDHGGDYDVIHDIASRELRRLQERGINVCVFKDGNNIHAMKIMEAGSRTAGLVEQYARLHGETGGATPRGYPYRSGDAGVGGGVDTKSSGESADESRRDGPESRGSALAASMAGESGTMPSPELNLEIDSIEWIRQAQGSRQETRGLPRPRLLTQQLFATVKEAGVELVSCSGEADLQLARASAEDSTNRTFVLGTDNDFFFFSGCRYITLGSLEFTDDAVTAPVWTRAHLAHLLELSEAQAVEWALLVGNDFTNAIYNEAMFHALPEMMLRRGRLPRETLWWLRNQSAGFRIKADPWRTCESGLGTVSDAEFADLALDFSRALYELEPLENLIGDLGGGLDGLPRTSDTSSSEGQTDPVSRETESVGSGAGAEAHDAGLKHGDGEARCADAVGQELTGSMWAPFRDAPASLAGIASSYRCSAPREDGAGESHGVEGYAFDAVKDADKDGDHGPVRQKNGTLSSMGCLDNPELVARILERPWGNVVLEAIRATVAPQESEDETWVEADEAQTVALVWCALGKRKRLDDDAKLAWRDIVIALNYQGHLWRLYREYRSENPSSKAPMPCAHFHGPTFHAAARDFRRFAESRARAVEQRREESDSSTQSEGYGSAGSTLSSGFGQEPSGEDESVRLPYVGEVRRESEGGEEQVDERPLPVAVDDCRAVAAR